MKKMKMRYFKKFLNKPDKENDDIAEKYKHLYDYAIINLDFEKRRYELVETKASRILVTVSIVSGIFSVFLEDFPLSSLESVTVIDLIICGYAGVVIWALFMSYFRIWLAFKFIETEALPLDMDYLKYAEGGNINLATLRRHSIMNSIDSLATIKKAIDKKNKHLEKAHFYVGFSMLLLLVLIFITVIQRYLLT